MSTETNSIQACKGWQCLVAQPENPDQAGWRNGYCPECLDELARDEIRAEHQNARNESDTPITDALLQTIRELYKQDHLTGDGMGVLLSDASKVGHLERRLAETERQRDELAAALEAINRRSVIFGSTGEYRRGQIDALTACSDVASNKALFTLNRKPE